MCLNGPTMFPNVIIKDITPKRPNNVLIFNAFREYQSLNTSRSKSGMTSKPYLWYV